MNYTNDNKKSWQECLLKSEVVLQLWGKTISVYNTPTHGKYAMGGWPYIADLFILAQEVLKESKINDL